MLIQTNQRELSTADVLNVVQRHQPDARHKRRLKRYYLGEHDILRKVGRTNTDVNNKLVANYTAYITNVQNVQFSFEQDKPGGQNCSG